MIAAARALDAEKLAALNRKDIDTAEEVSTNTAAWMFRHWNPFLNHLCGVAFFPEPLKGVRGWTSHMGSLEASKDPKQKAKSD
jgi:hypothetical protein